MAKKILMFCLALVIGIALAIPAMASTVQNPMVENLGGGGYSISNVSDIIAKGPQVDVRAYASFSAAIDAIGASEKTLLIPNQQNVTANKTVPANITLQFLQGGSLNISAGQTVTVNGYVEAGLYQIFSGSGSVSGLKKVYTPWFGAKIDGSTDDSAACQKALDALVAGGECIFPKSNLNCLIRTQLSVNNGGISLTGDVGGTAIVCVGCSGIFVNKAGGVRIKNITIALYPRYTQTVNNYVGIDLDGDTNNHSFSNLIRDVCLDGFRTAIEANWIWATVFDHVNAGFGHIGLDVRGLSVNNVITNSSLDVDGTSGSCCVVLGDNTNASEGWMISNNLFYGAETGIYGTGCSHVSLINNIIDFCAYNGICIYENGANAVSVNWLIQNNYIAMTGAIALDNGIIALQNTANSQTEGHKIIGNTIRCYNEGTCNYGIRMAGAECKNNMIIGNSLKGFGTYDIILDGGEATNIATGNQCLSNLTTNIYVPNGGLIQNNVGNVYYTQFTTYGTVGKMKIVYGETAPTSGTWNQGDICWRTTPAASQAPGWICVTAGTPGTWKAMANLAP